MKQPKISNLKYVTQEMIDALERWLESEWYGCPLGRIAGVSCDIYFDNIPEGCEDVDKNCPCNYFGQEATILAFTIICDIWEVYHKEAT